MELTERAEFIGFATYQRMEQARLDLARARWDDALAVVEELPEAAPARCVALTVAGTAQAPPRRRRRRRRHSTRRAALADELGELQRRGPVAAARAEAALLRGDLAAARAIARPEFDEADPPRRPSACAPSSRTCCAAPATTSRSRPRIAHPFAVQARGDWRRAADLWRDGRTPRTTRPRRSPRAPTRPTCSTALAILDRIGAVPLARRVRADLRDRGVRSIPRGPSSPTRRNPEGLTDRQVGVLELLAEGLTNAEIADRLVVSVRTVDSHVAAVLTKLGVQTPSGRRARRAASSACSRRALGSGSVRPEHLGSARPRSPYPARMPTIAARVEWDHGSPQGGLSTEEGSSWTPHSP